MALKIRLRKQGRNNRQTFRVVLADSRSPRDGKYLEMLGWYNPFQAENNISVDAERMNHWIGLGAQLSPQVESLICKIAPGVVQDLNTKRQAKRVKMAAKRRAVKKTTKATK